MTSPRSLRFLVLGVSLGSALLSAAEQSAMPFRAITYAEAAKAAATEQKLVFIDFYTTWCGPCKMLDAQTWTDAEVGKLVDAKTVPLRMDAEKEGVDLAKKYAIQAYPTMLLLKPDGAEVDRIIGFEPPEKFMSDFKVSLTGKNAVARAREAAQAAAEDRLEQQVRARHELARKLMLAGRYDEARVEYLWLYDTGMKQAPGYSGVRNSFLTSEMGRLAKAYPPAREDLRQRRDDAKRRMMEGTSKTVAAREFAALNDALGDAAATLAVFDVLAPGDPRRGAMGLQVYPQLVVAKRYKDALEAQPFTFMSQMLDNSFRTPPNATPEVKEALRKYCVKNTAVNIETLAGAGESSEAGMLIKRVLEIDSSDETKQLLRDHLALAGHPELMNEAK